MQPRIQAVLTMVLPTMYAHIVQPFSGTRKGFAIKVHPLKDASLIICVAEVAKFPYHRPSHGHRRYKILFVLTVGQYLIGSCD